MKKQIPRLETDEEAAQFIDGADLSEYDLSGFKPATFEVQDRAASLNVRVPRPLLDAVKRKAEARGITYTRFVRELLEEAVRKPGATRETP
jgi:predicted DNA binding CopG/RHH family protein